MATVPYATVYRYPLGSDQLATERGALLGYMGFTVAMVREWDIRIDIPLDQIKKLEQLQQSNPVMWGDATGTAMQSLNLAALGSAIRNVAALLAGLPEEQRNTLFPEHEVLDQVLERLGTKGEGAQETRSSPGPSYAPVPTPFA